MSKAIENLQAAQHKAMAIRPKVGGFPFLAETLRRAGVSRNIWTVPACQSVYLTDDAPVVTVGTPLSSGTTDVPPFDRDALIAALRRDQAATARFQFLAASWKARVVRYDVDFNARTLPWLQRSTSKAIPPLKSRDDHGCQSPVTSYQPSC